MRPNHLRAVPACEGRLSHLALERGHARAGIPCARLLVSHLPTVHPGRPDLSFKYRKCLRCPRNIPPKSRDTAVIETGGPFVYLNSPVVRVWPVAKYLHTSSARVGERPRSRRILRPDNLRQRQGQREQSVRKDSMKDR